uniref:Uncharacterized protein n=1 Tax=Rhizophora mucronata TaxID=61149 RepID=A0A2P2QJ98_RHIMU
MSYSVFFPFVFVVFVWFFCFLAQTV